MWSTSLAQAATVIHVHTDFPSFGETILPDFHALLSYPRPKRQTGRLGTTILVHVIRSCVTDLRRECDRDGIVLAETNFFERFVSRISNHISCEQIKLLLDSSILFHWCLAACVRVLDYSSGMSLGRNSYRWQVPSIWLYFIGKSTVSTCCCISTVVLFAYIF